VSQEEIILGSQLLGHTSLAPLLQHLVHHFLFPKDDSNVSKRATPESKNARPCRHCGSGKHWDYECKHAIKGNKIARTHLATSTSDDLEAQEEYDNLFYELSEDEEETSRQQEETSEVENSLDATAAHVNCTQIQGNSTGHANLVNLESSFNEDEAMINRKSDIENSVKSSVHTENVKSFQSDKKIEEFL
jgi:hypothetical protein